MQGLLLFWVYGVDYLERPWLLSRVQRCIWKVSISVCDALFLATKIGSDCCKLAYTNVFASNGYPMIKSNGHYFNHIVIFLLNYQMLEVQVMKSLNLMQAIQIKMFYSIWGLNVAQFCWNLDSTPTMIYKIDIFTDLIKGSGSIWGLNIRDTRLKLFNNV